MAKIPSKNIPFVTMDSVLTFGKYKGMTLNKILNGLEDSKYVEYLVGENAIEADEEVLNLMDLLNRSH